MALDLPTLPPTSPCRKLSAGHRQGHLVLAPTQAVAVIVAVAVKNATVSPVAAVGSTVAAVAVAPAAAAADDVVSLSSSSMRRRLPSAPVRIRERRRGRRRRGGTAFDRRHRRFERCCRRLATVARAAVVDAREGQGVFVEEGGVVGVGVGMIVVIVATAV